MFKRGLNTNSISSDKLYRKWLRENKIAEKDFESLCTFFQKCENIKSADFAKLSLQEHNYFLKRNKVTKINFLSSNKIRNFVSVKEPSKLLGVNSELRIQLSIEMKREVFVIFK